MKRRLIIVILILITLPVTVFAQGNRGYIRLQMVYDGRAVSGGTVTLYDVSDSPEGFGVQELMEYVEKHNILGCEKQVDGSGFVLFEDLPAGVYLLVQHQAPQGFYPINPFFVRLSMVADGTLVDCVDAAPKLEPEKKLPQTGQLIWPSWILIGAGVLLVGLGLLRRERK